MKQQVGKLKDLPKGKIYRRTHWQNDLAFKYCRDEGEYRYLAENDYTRWYIVSMVSDIPEIFAVVSESVLNSDDLTVTPVIGPLCNLREKKIYRPLGMKDDSKDFHNLGLSYYVYLNAVDERVEDEILKGIVEVVETLDIEDNKETK